MNTPNNKDPIPKDPTCPPRPRKTLARRQDPEDRLTRFTPPSPDSPCATASLRRSQAAEDLDRESLEDETSTELLGESEADSEEPPDELDEEEEAEMSDKPTDHGPERAEPPQEQHEPLSCSPGAGENHADSNKPSTYPDVPESRS